MNEDKNILIPIDRRLGRPQEHHFDRKVKNKGEANLFGETSPFCRST